MSDSSISPDNREEWDKQRRAAEVRTPRGTRRGIAIAATVLVFWAAVGTGYWLVSKHGSPVAASHPVPSFEPATPSLPDIRPLSSRQLQRVSQEVVDLAADGHFSKASALLDEASQKSGCSVTVLAAGPTDGTGPDSPETKAVTADILHGASTQGAVVAVYVRAPVTERGLKVFERGGTSLPDGGVMHAVVAEFCSL